MEKFAGHILLITGQKDIGKTSLCRQVIEVARKASWHVNGLLSPPVIKGGLKIGIGVEDLATGKRFLLAHLPGSEEVEADDQSGPAVRTENWVFDTRCLNWGNTVLEQAVPCDLLVIDELGPLELEQNVGWTAGLKAVDSGKFHLAIVVVREALLNKLTWRWPKATTITVTGAERIERMVEKIIAKLASLQGVMGEET